MAELGLPTKCENELVYSAKASRTEGGIAVLAELSTAAHTFISASSPHGDNLNSALFLVKAPY